MADDGCGEHVLPVAVRDDMLLVPQVDDDGSVPALVALPALVR